ncbi:MAG: tetratricopeptide repeat protein [Thermodesulfobacteriota bacterium]
MSKDEAGKYFAEGKRLMQKERLDRAMRAFGKAHREDRTNPYYMSYFGLTKALKGGDIGFGIDLCTKAIKRDFSKAELYLNLGKVYLSVGNKKGAVSIFKKGIKFEPGNKELKKQLADLGISKPSGQPIIESKAKRPGFFSKLFSKVFQA